MFLFKDKWISVIHLLLFGKMIIVVCFKNIAVQNLNGIHYDTFSRETTYSYLPMQNICHSHFITVYTNNNMTLHISKP